MTQEINLVAAVGRGGAIGPKDGLPRFKSHAEGVAFGKWFMDMSAGGVILTGRKTFEMLDESGWRPAANCRVAVWTRQAGLTPEEYLTEAKQFGVPIFVIGGQSTYAAFMPHVTQFLIRRAELRGPTHCHMPPMFGRTN
jgi:dihydrofolate reductase